MIVSCHAVAGTQSYCDCAWGALLNSAELWGALHLPDAFLLSQGSLIHCRY